MLETRPAPEYCIIRKSPVRPLGILEFGDLVRIPLRSPEDERTYVNAATPVGRNSFRARAMREVEHSPPFRSLICSEYATLKYRLGGNIAHTGLPNTRAIAHCEIRSRTSGAYVAPAPAIFIPGGIRAKHFLTARTSGLIPMLIYGVVRNEITPAP